MGLEKPLGKYSFKQCHVRRCTERTCRGFQRLYKSLNMHPHINTLHIFAYSDRIWYMKKIHKIIYIHHLPIAVYVNSIDIIYIYIYFRHTPWTLHGLGDVSIRWLAVVPWLQWLPETVNPRTASLRFLFQVPVVLLSARTYANYRRHLAKKQGTH